MKLHSLVMKLSIFGLSLVMKLQPFLNGKLHPSSVLRGIALGLAYFFMARMAFIAAIAFMAFMAFFFFMTRMAFIAGAAAAAFIALRMAAFFFMTRMAFIAAIAFIAFMAFAIMTGSGGKKTKRKVLSLA